MALRKRPMTRRPRRRGIRRGGMLKRKTNRYAVKTYAFKRWANPVYITNNIDEDPSKFVTSDVGQLQLGSSTADIVLGTYEVGGVFSPQLQNVINYTEFTNLFDQYQIAGIKFKITPLKNVNTGSSNPYLPEIVVSRDLDDVTVPATDFDLLQRQDAKPIRMTRPLNFYCKPGVLVDQAGTNANIVPFGNTRRNLYLDCNAVDIVHPSFKFWMRNVWLGNAGGTAVANTFALRVDTCYYLKMKNVR